MKLPARPGRRSSFGGCVSGPLCAGLLVLCAGASMALADGVVPAPDAQLRGTYPGLASTEWNGRTMAFAGVPMTPGATPRQAADAWMALYRDAFGAGPVELTADREYTISMGRSSVVRYRQTMDGLPVEFGMVKAIVRNSFEGPGNSPLSQVVMVSAKLAPRPAGGFAPLAVSSQQAVQRVQRIARFGAMDTWSQPELVVFFGEGDFDRWLDQPVRAWKFTGEHSDVSKAQRFTFFVDAATNELVHARNEILHADLVGQVVGVGTPGNQAQTAAVTPVPLPMPEIVVRVQGTSTQVFADRNGNFTIPWTGSAPVTLEVGTLAPAGRFSRVDNQVAPEIFVTQEVTPGVPTTITMNATPNEGATAEINAFIHTTITRNFVRDRAPSFTQLDTIGASSAFAILPANVMVAGSCNAFYNGSSTNYYPAGGSPACNNTAFASVVAHEFGHHIVNRLNLAQGAFGEGYSDTISLLIYNDPIVGRNFTQAGGFVRNPDAANQQFPCASTAIHTCGQILGGVVWDMRSGFIARYGPSDGLELMRQLHIDWSQTTLGGEGLNSAHPTAALQYLTVDDDNGFLCDGTPNLAQIRTAFQNHGITSPFFNAETRAQMQLVGPAPSTVPIGAPVSATIRIAPGTATITPGTARVLYRHGPTNSFVTAPLNSLGNDLFQASLPGVNCGQTVEFSFAVDTSAGTVTYPAGCDFTGPFTARGENSSVIATDAFETSNPNWTVASTATTGQWVRADPVGVSGVQPEDDTTPAPGVNCWVTGNAAPGAANGTADIDGGNTVLTSDVYNTAGLQDVRVSYNRWYSNGSGAGPYSDVFRIEATTDGGATWFPAETIGPGSASDPNVNGGWRAASWTLRGLGRAPGATLRIRFNAEDAGTGSIVEAAIDDLRVESLSCTGCNDLDFNNDGDFPSPLDVEDFITSQAGGACSTGNCDSLDFNNDGDFPSPVDLEAFINANAGQGC